MIDTNLQESLSPLILLSSGVALKFFDSKSREKLILWFPSRENISNWIVFMCVLGIMKDDYDKNFMLRTNFTQGQKLLINGSVVEYLGESIKEGVGNTISIKFRDNKKDPLGRVSYIEYTRPWNEKSYFQPITTSKDVSTARKFYESLTILANKPYQLDLLLDIKSNGNRNFFEHNLIFVTKIGEAEEFIKNHKINGTKLKEIFLWGKIDAEGNVSTISDHRIDADPSCLVASDLFSVLAYLSNNKNKTKGIIIDGSSKYIDSLQALDDLLEYKINTMVISDIKDSVNLKALVDRDFLIWQWNKKWVKLNKGPYTSVKESNFYEFERSLSFFCDTTVRIERAKNETIEKIIDLCIASSKNYYDDAIEINTMKKRLIKLTNNLTRLIRTPDKKTLADLNDKLERIKSTFNAQKQWLSPEDIENVSSLLLELSDYIKKPQANPEDKTSILFKYFVEMTNNSSCRTKRLIVITLSQKEAEATEEYWKQILNGEYQENIKFISYDNFIRLKNISWDNQVFISGWFNSNKINCLLDSFIAQNYIFLLYPQEEKWLDAFQKKKEKDNEFEIKAKDFSDLLRTDERYLDFLNYSPSFLTSSSDVQPDVFDDFELKYRNSQYTNYLSTGPAEEKIKAKLIAFNDNNFSFITQTHKLYVINDFFSAESSRKEILPTLIDDLKVSDRVLFRETGRDIIREIADSVLIKSGREDVISASRLWRESLKKSYEGYQKDYQEFLQDLRQKGCRRHSATIRIWLTDENIIGPHDESDLDIITAAIKDEVLTTKLSQVKRAIKEVRNAHLLASNYLQKKLLHVLPKLLDNNTGNPLLLTAPPRDVDKTNMSINIEGLGKLHILMVEEISNEWMDVDIRKVNKLYVREEE
ncbi:MAG: DrmE family protein [Patescibacteria group bacterium]